MACPVDDRTEWLEADGLGGFASGTATGIRTRRYHALLLAATTPPTGRFVLVSGQDAWLETATGTYPLSSQRYAPGIVHPHGALRIAAFTADPWPRWIYRLEDGTEVEHELVVPRGLALVAQTWTITRRGPASRDASLLVRPLFSGRDYHALHHENRAFDFEARTKGELVRWRPYAGVPGIIARSSGAYRHAPDWYRNFQYDEERDRGLECTEDLAAPGIFQWSLSTHPDATPRAVLLLAAELTDTPGGASAAELIGGPAPAESLADDLRARERSRRQAFPSPLERAADSYIVQRGAGKTIIAGYPWFTDWGRDTFIALRGLCLATGRLDEARDILVQWADAVSEGMLPNRFPDAVGAAPEYNAVDASLWYVVAVGEYLDAMTSAGLPVPAAARRDLQGAVGAIVAGYARGTRYGIRMEPDGLIAAGEPGVQLTWMDAKYGNWVVTPRIGKPVEIQALWINALAVACRFDAQWAAPMDRARRAFPGRFWNESRRCLYDVVDVDHRQGAVDALLRPNQLFAVGGLPLAVLDGPMARQVVDVAEAALMTPLGPRSLAPGEPGYIGRYEGGPGERDGAYHQGAVWPWLIGAFVEAWVRVRAGTDEAKREARAAFLDPLMAHLDGAGVGHITEIADGDAPHTPRGCPFQAWSVAEAIRLDKVVLAETGTAPGRHKAPRQSCEPAAHPRRPKRSAT